MAPKSLCKPHRSSCRTATKWVRPALSRMSRWKQAGTRSSQTTIPCSIRPLKFWRKDNEKAIPLYVKRVVDCLLPAEGYAGAAKPAAFHTGTQIGADRLSWHGWEYVYH